MDSTAASNEATATQEVAWNEARIESSMAQLQEMHARVRKSYSSRARRRLTVFL